MEEAARFLQESGLKIQQLARESLEEVEIAQTQEGEAAYRSFKSAEQFQLQASQEYVRAIQERTQIFHEQIETNQVEIEKAKRARERARTGKGHE